MSKRSPVSELEQNGSPINKEAAMKGFGIYVKNDLLDPKHIKAMQVSQKTTSLWMYLWFLDKMTRIEQGRQTGLVLGGKPIKLNEICDDLGLNIKTARKMFQNLHDKGYIEVVRAPYGSVVRVTKAHKIFGNKSGRSGAKRGRSLPQNAQNLVGLGSKRGRSNKTIQYDNTVKDNISELANKKPLALNKSFRAEFERQRSALIIRSKS